MKRLDFFKRRPDLDLAAFRAHVQETYAQSQCVLHFTHDSGYRAHEPDYDCVVELSADDAGAPRGDEVGFSDPSTFGSVVACEVVIVDGVPPAGSLTMFAFLNRLPGTEPAAFHAVLARSPRPDRVARPGDAPLRAEPGDLCLRPGAGV